ncbi:hypothetical protein Pst134EB_006009 [Puccinia striiformis f. sp. tritici]|nr:hypothetical protein Pst134EB_006009 [Puccinia striiformis f. sp. tritici]
MMKTYVKFDDLDILIVFEDEIKRAEKETMELKAKQKMTNEGLVVNLVLHYIKLLHELKISEKLKVVEELLDERAKKVLETTEFDEFLTWLPNDIESHKLDPSILKQVFHMLVDSAARIAKEEKRRAEKRLRNKIEDLRYALKKCFPHPSNLMPLMKKP